MSAVIIATNWFAASFTGPRASASASPAATATSTAAAASQASPLAMVNARALSARETRPARRVAPGVSPGGSHRSGRAEFPHPAPQVTGSLGATLRAGLGIGSG